MRAKKKIRSVHNFSSTIYTEKTIEIKSKYLMMHEEKESSTNISIQGDRHKKSINLQYNTLVRWADDGTNDSSTKRLMFQV